MDEFSLYGTIGAIILIQVSFFWLFRYDHYTRKLSNDYMQSNRLVVILVGTSNQLTNDGASLDVGQPDINANYSSELILIEKLRKQLESGDNNFKVITVLLAPHKRNEREQQEHEQQIIMRDGIVRLNSNKINYYHLKQVVNCIESQLTLETNLKLHAYVDIQQVVLPERSDNETRRPFDVLDQLRNHSIPANGILLALKAHIARDCSRIVFVRDWRHRFASADQHSHDICWQFFEQFDQNLIDFVDKSEHYQNSPAPIQVDIQQQRPDSAVQNASKQQWASTAIIDSIKSFSLLGDFTSKPVKSSAIVETSYDPADENTEESHVLSESGKLAEVSKIAAKISELIMLENPRSITVTV